MPFWAHAFVKNSVSVACVWRACQDLNKESKRIARYRARMEAVDKWMSKRSLPKGLRHRIGHYYQEVCLQPCAPY